MNNSTSVLATMSSVANEVSKETVIDCRSLLNRSSSDEGVKSQVKRSSKLPVKIGKPHDNYLHLKRSKDKENCEQSTTVKSHDVQHRYITVYTVVIVVDVSYGPYAPSID